MKVLGPALTFMLSSCSSKVKKISSNDPPVKKEFHSIDANQDLFISPEEYSLYQQIGYDSSGPTIWFLIILGLVFLFSVVLGYFIKDK